MKNSVDEIIARSSANSSAFKASTNSRLMDPNLRKYSEKLEKTMSQSMSSMRGAYTPSVDHGETVSVLKFEAQIWNSLGSHRGADLPGDSHEGLQVAD